MTADQVRQAANIILERTAPTVHCENTAALDRWAVAVAETLLDADERLRDVQAHLAYLEDMDWLREREGRGDVVNDEFANTCPPPEGGGGGG